MGAGLRMHSGSMSGQMLWNVELIRVLCAGLCTLCSLTPWCVLLALAFLALSGSYLPVLEVLLAQHTLGFNPYMWSESYLLVMI